MTNCDHSTLSQTNQNSSSQDRDSDIDHTPGTGEASPSREVAPEEVYSSPPPPPPVVSLLPQSACDWQLVVICHRTHAHFHCRHAHFMAWSLMPCAVVPVCMRHCNVRECCVEAEWCTMAAEGNKGVRSCRELVNIHSGLFPSRCQKSGMATYSAASPPSNFP